VYQNNKITPLPFFHGCRKRPQKNQRHTQLRWIAIRKPIPPVTSAVFLIIIISLLMSSLLGHRSSLWIIVKENYIRRKEGGIIKEY
jgi:hypothetical protein